MSITLRLDLSDQAMRHLADGLDKWVAETAIDVERYAKELAPVDTGTLRRSIAIQHLSRIEAHIGTPIEYAVFVHDGTRYMAARPFLLEGVMLAEQAAGVRLADLARRLNSGQ